MGLQSVLKSQLNNIHARRLRATVTMTTIVRNDILRVESVSENHALVRLECCHKSWLCIFPTSTWSVVNLVPKAIL
jgi:hypothetical protein